MIKLVNYQQSDRPIGPKAMSYFISACFALCTMLYALCPNEPKTRYDKKDNKSQMENCPLLEVRNDGREAANDQHSC